MEEKINLSAPVLNQACKTHREFERYIDIHETTQGERYLSAMVINPTIQYALSAIFGPMGNQKLFDACAVYRNGKVDHASTAKAAKKAIMTYMHSRYAAIPYQNYQQKMEVLQYDFNRVYRYIKSEYRAMNTHPASAEFMMAGKKHRFTPTLTHECGNHIDVICIKLGKSKYTRSGRKNEYNRDMQLYEMVLYGRARGFASITAQFLYLTRSDDVSDWNACEPNFFAGNGNNTFDMHDVWDGNPNNLDKQMADKIRMMSEGVDEEDMPEDECTYCKYTHICKHTLPPKRVEEEISELSSPVTKELIEFSEKQEQVRTFENGILRVIATAGSGKTFTSMAHVAYLIQEKDVKPRDILLVTFSNAGVKEMGRKLKRMLGYDPAEPQHGMKITTFHGLFYEIVKDQWQNLGFGKFPGVLNAVQRFSKIADILAENPIFEWKGASFRNFSVKKGGWNDIGALAVVSDIFSQIKLSGRDAATINSWEIHTYCDIPAAAIQKVIGLYGKYEQYCKENGLIDFDDMELLAFQVIENDPEYLERTYGFKHSIIDEFQDTSAYEMEMVKRLKMLPTFESMMIVGDDDQSIYRFRGTSPEFMLNFHQLINEPYQLRTDTQVEQPDVRKDKVTDIMLDVNYRSRQEIIDLGCKMLEPNTDKIQKNIHAARGDGGSILVRGHADKKHLLSWLVNSIQSQHDHGVPWESICVLAYKKSKLRDIADALTRKNIPSMMGAPEPMSENSRVDSILAFARVLLDPTDTLDAANAAAALYYAENPTTETEFIHLPADEIQEKIDEVLERALNINQETSPEKQKEGFLQYVSDVMLDDEAVERFMEPLETLDFEDSLKYCRDFVLYGVNEEFRRLDEYPGVKLITAHSAKGLEWPVVYLDLTDFSDIGGSKSTSLADIEEVRRLMYVSMTRARDQLFVTGVFSKTGKKIGEEIMNWCLHEAYVAADMDWERAYGLAKTELNLEKAERYRKKK